MCQLHGKFGLIFLQFSLDFIAFLTKLNQNLKYKDREYTYAILFYYLILNYLEILDLSYSVSDNSVICFQIGIRSIK